MPNTTNDLRAFLERARMVSVSVRGDTVHHLVEKLYRSGAAAQYPIVGDLHALTCMHATEFKEATAMLGSTAAMIDISGSTAAVRLAGAASASSSSSSSASAAAVPHRKRSAPKARGNKKAHVAAAAAAAVAADDAEARRKYDSGSDGDESASSTDMV